MNRTHNNSGEHEKRNKNDTHSTEGSSYTNIYIMRIIYINVRRPCSSVLEYYGLPCGEYNGTHIVNIYVYNNNILLYIRTRSTHTHRTCILLYGRRAV